MRCFVVSLFLTILLFNSSSAGVLKIVGVDVVWSSLTDPSPSFYVMIFNESDVPATLMSWQVCLEITSEGETTGVVQFASGDLPRDKSYLLHDDSWVLIEENPSSPWIFGPMESVTIFDYSYSTVGVEVTSTMKKLLEVDFAALEVPHGTFAVNVVPGTYSTFWTSSDDPFTFLEFANVPFDAPESVRIGSVLIPEPRGFLLFVTLAMTCVVGYRIRGNRSENCKEWAV